jgi:hypothetical protein
LCADVYLLRPTIGNRRLVYSQLVVSAASGMTSQLLERLRLKTHVKRLFRRA